MSDETRINQEGDEVALNFTTLSSNIQAILDEPEVETVLGRIQMKKEDFLNEVLADIRSEDGGVDFYGFMKIEKVHKEAGTARSPQTGETIAIPAKDVPKAKFSSRFKKAVNGEA